MKDKVKKFRCCSCRRTHDGEPSMKNKAGKFCTACNYQRMRKVAATRLKKRESLDGKCRLCGIPLVTKEQDPVNWTSYRPDASSCRDCICQRKWIVRCLLHSNAILTEAHRVKERIDRKNDKIAKEPEVAPEFEQDDDPDFFATEKASNGLANALEKEIKAEKPVKKPADAGSPPVAEQQPQPLDRVEAMFLEMKQINAQLQADTAKLQEEYRTLVDSLGGLPGSSTR